MDILINSLFEHVTASANRPVDRVLWISHDGHKLVVIDMSAEDALPRTVERSEVEAGIDSGDLKVLDNDPYSTLEILPAEIKTKHIACRDKARQLITPIVELPGDGTFIPGERGPVLSKISEETGTSKRMLYLFLRRYWRGGQRWNSLLPRYYNCGAPGKKRRAGETKLGRPRKLV